MQFANLGFINVPFDCLAIVIIATWCEKLNQVIFSNSFHAKKPKPRPPRQKQSFSFLYLPSSAFISLLLHPPPLVFEISFLSNTSFIKKIKRFWLSNQFYPPLQHEDKRARTHPHRRARCSRAQAARRSLQHGATRCCSALIREVWVMKRRLCMEAVAVKYQGRLKSKFRCLFSILQWSGASFCLSGHFTLPALLSMGTVRVRKAVEAIKTRTKQLYYTSLPQVQQCGWTDGRITNSTLFTRAAVSTAKTKDGNKTAKRWFGFGWTHELNKWMSEWMTFMFVHL